MLSHSAQQSSGNAILYVTKIQYLGNAFEVYSVVNEQWLPRDHYTNFVAEIGMSLWMQ